MCVPDASKGGCSTRMAWTDVKAAVVVFNAPWCRYYVNRDTLFCYHKASEAFLQRLMALYVASHYKVSVGTVGEVVLRELWDCVLLLYFC